MDNTNDRKENIKQIKDRYLKRLRELKQKRKDIIDDFVDGLEEYKIKELRLDLDS